MARPVDDSPAQRRLLEAAVDAFAEHGFGGTTTRDIATRAGRSPAAVYIHHSSKEELLYAVSLFGHLEALRCLEAAARPADSGDPADPADRLWTMVAAFSRWHMDNARLGRVVQYELHALSEEHRREIRVLRRSFRELFVEALRAGVEAGDFHVEDLSGTARALLSLCIDFVRWFDPALGQDPQAEATLNADLALRMVQARPPGQPGRHP